MAVVNPNQLDKRMKRTSLTLLLSIAAGITTAYQVQEFQGWDRLEQDSPDIVVARCAETPDPNNFQQNGRRIDFQGLYWADIEIVSILKGATNWDGLYVEPPKLGPAKICSEYCPQQHEYYLIYSHHHDGAYQAIEHYRFLPHGLNFYTNTLSGKTLDEQIKSLFERRLIVLNVQIQRDQEEKVRLEEALKR